MEYLYVILFCLAAFLAAIAVTVSFGSVLHISNKFGDKVLQGLLILISVLIALSAVISGRDLTHVGESINNLYNEDTGGGTLVIKSLTWMIVLLLLGILCDRIIKIRTNIKKKEINFGWLILFILFVFTNGIISSIFGTYPKFSPGLLYPLIFLMILAVDSTWSPRELLSSIKLGILIIFLVGFAVLMAKPSLVLEGGVTGSLALLPFRYWGASPHANALGSMAVLYLLLEILTPTSNKFWRLAGVIAAFISIVLCQSKTALLGLAFSLICVWIVPTQRKPGISSNEPDIKSILKLLFIMLLPVIIYITLFIAGYESKLDQLLTSDAGKSITTLTGRTRIWEVALTEWHNNPIFGYGPDLFSLEYRMRKGMLFAFHAHNQFIQSLAQSGLIGLFGLLLFLGIISFKLAMRAIVSKGVSLALLAFLFIRCMTEVPLRSGDIISGEYLYLLALVAIAMSSPTSLLALSSPVVPATSDLK